MAIYVDAVDWVSLPNTPGMSQHGDGGIVGTKPYVSTRNYIHRMSPFCSRCRHDLRQATADDAWLFTTLSWDFLDRHYGQLKRNHRTGMRIKNLEKKRNNGEIDEILSAADALKRRLRR